VYFVEREDLCRSMTDSLPSYTSPAKSKIGDWAVRTGRRCLEALASSLPELSKYASSTDSSSIRLLPPSTLRT
jgi:hypothetical protein